MAIAEGHEVSAVAFERDFHKGRMPNCSVNYIGKIDNQKYLSRLPALLKAIPLMRRAIAEADVVYALGIDLALLAIIAGTGFTRPVRVLEIGDIRHLQTRRGVIGDIYRIFDRWLSNRLDLIVVTARDFLEVYYRTWLKVQVTGLVIENKLEAEQVLLAKKNLATIKSASANRPITIGYFGLLQSPWSWRVLKELARNNPDTHRIVLAGLPIRFSDIDETCEALSNVSFLGQYKSPDDLAPLYEQVDLAWGCYSPLDAHDWNLRWARPNRFYEACAYETPLISRYGSVDGTVVREREIGFVMEETDCKAAALKLSEISHDSIGEWRQNMKDLPRSIYTYTDESQKLSELLLAISARSTIK